VPLNDSTVLQMHHDAFHFEVAHAGNRKSPCDWVSLTPQEAAQAAPAEFLVFAAEVLQAALPLLPVGEGAHVDG
jgi:hypothetical protein